MIIDLDKASFITYTYIIFIQNFSAERLREVQEQTFVAYSYLELWKNIHLKQISNVVRENFNYMTPYVVKLSMCTALHRSKTDNT